MSSAPHVDPFTGTDWEECNGFIRALRFRALWEGKQRDPAWIADFAAPHFSHQALAWHCRLPQDVRQDWFKLEAAMIERWAPSENNDGVQIEPTPAAAPSINHTKKAEPPHQGVIKVVIDESDKNRYLKLGGPNTDCRLTDDVGEALRVRCNSLSNATLLERTDGSCHSWLTIQWGLGPGETPNLEVRSTDYFFLSHLDSESLKSSWVTPKGHWQLMDCIISTNGEVIPRWRKDDTSKTTLILTVEHDALMLVVDPDIKFGEEKNVKLFIEAVDGT